MSGIVALLFMEYRFFKHEAVKMIALKEDYQNHLVAVNRVLQEYNKTKERLEQLEGAQEGEKKKVINLTEIDTGFPEGVTIFSSDDEPDENKDSFKVLNRELEYLKQSSLGYLKEHKLDLVMQRINAADCWEDYTDLKLKNSTINERPKKGKNKRKRRRNIVSRRHLPTDYAQKREQFKKDILFTWPIERSNFWLSSFFGPRKKANGSPGFHYGIDMAAVRGTPVYPAADGVVVEARTAPGYGKTVVVAHNHKYRTRYAHLHTINVRIGQNVTPNDMLGKVGSTGTVRSKKGRDASHLHFEVYVFGKKVNPMYFFA